jgi:Tfp pilus assembly PilM family ATPase/cell division protein FtsB
MKSIFTERALGIDIRERSVALTLIGKNFRNTEILASKFIDLKLLTDKDEKTEKHFLNEINRFLIEHDAWSNAVAVGLPRSLVMFKTFELPAPDIKAVYSMIEFELERHFPSGLEELYYTYQLTKKSGNTYHIALVAIKKETANYYLKLIEKLNLKTTILDIPTFSNANLALPLKSKDSILTALIDISPCALEVVLMKKEVLEYSRNRTWEGTDIKDAYSGRKISSDQRDSITKSMANLIIKELEQALSSCSNIQENEAIQHIFIVGGGSLTTQIKKYLEKETEVAIQIINVPNSISYNALKSFSQNHIMTALSLASRVIKRQNINTNLLPIYLQSKRKNFNPKTSLALVATVLVFLGIWISSQIYLNKKTLASLDHQLQEIKGEVSNLEKIDLEHISIQKYVEIFNTIDKQYPSKLPLLGRLSQSLPKDTWLTNIKFQKGEMEIKGFSPSASKLIPLIEKSPRFKKTSFVGSIIRESMGEKFTIRAKLEPKL